MSDNTIPNQVKWIKVVSRPSLPLTVHMCLDGSRKIFEQLGKDFTFYYKTEYANFQSDIFLAEEVMKDINEIIVSNLRENKKFLKDILESGLKNCEQLISIAKEMSVDVEKLDDSQLNDALKKYVNAFFDFAPTTIVPFPVEILLTQLIKNRIKELNQGFTKEEVDECFRKITVVQRDSDAFQEQKDLLEIAILKESGIDIKGRLVEHADKFGYLGLTNSILSEPRNIEYFESMINQSNNPSEMLKKLLEDRSKELKEYKEYSKGMDKDLVKQAELLQNYMFFRAYRIDAMKRAQWNIRPLLNEICKHCDVKLEDLAFFIWPEIVKLLETGEVPDFEPRKKCFNMIVVNKKISWNTEPIQTDKLGYVGPIKGTVAQRGNVKGIVRLVLNENDMKRFKEGEILVTAMTTPDYVMIMNKALAIITDEGGILCHAAIVSREFNKPCIVGTGIATKVLKDGDIVRVDAINGIIEKVL